MRGSILSLVFATLAPGLANADYTVLIKNDTNTEIMIESSSQLMLDLKDEFKDDGVSPQIYLQPHEAYSFSYAENSPFVLEHINGSTNLDMAYFDYDISSIYNPATGTQQKMGKSCNVEAWFSDYDNDLLKPNVHAVSTISINLITGGYYCTPHDA